MFWFIHWVGCKTYWVRVSLEWDPCDLHVLSLGTVNSRLICSEGRASSLKQNQPKQLTNKAFTDAGKGRIRQSLTALVMNFCRCVFFYQFHNVAVLTTDLGVPNFSKFNCLTEAIGLWSMKWMVLHKDGINNKINAAYSILRTSLEESSLGCFKMYDTKTRCFVL